jgi:hypothetical protein
MRKAIENSILAALASGAKYFAILENGREITFRPSENGRIDVLSFDSHTGEETTSSFEVLVREIPNA